MDVVVDIHPSFQALTRDRRLIKASKSLRHELSSSQLSVESDKTLETIARGVSTMAKTKNRVETVGELICACQPPNRQKFPDWWRRQVPDQRR